MSVPAPLPAPHRGWHGVALTIIVTLAIVVSISVAVRLSQGTDSTSGPDRSDADRASLMSGPNMQRRNNIDQLVSEFKPTG